MRRAVIDIDNTLWPFCEPLYAKLSAVNPAIPPPPGWMSWDFWEDYVTREQFWEAITEVHLDQDSDAHLPYAEAGVFLKALRGTGHHVVIASHRAHATRVQTEKWLTRHGLEYDELHLSFDKTVLFTPECRVVVDDAPDILAKAAQAGALAAGLLCPWNSTTANGSYRLFRTLEDILEYVLAGLER
jgi:hypothetical protein